jgi:hypothetical protein
LHRGKMKAHQVVCFSNQRQVGLQFRLMVDDCGSRFTAPEFAEWYEHLGDPLQCEPHRRREAPNYKRRAGAIAIANIRRASYNSYIDSVYREVAKCQERQKKTRYFLCGIWL